MGRPQIPCQVPGCKGRIERGKHPSGAVLEWCATCERRLLQLEALQAKLATVAPAAAATSRTLSDAELLAQVAARCLTLKRLAKKLRRGVNGVLHAAKTHQIPSLVFGRTRILPVASAQAHFDAIPRRFRVQEAGRAIIAALPRSAREAIPARELARRAGRSEKSIHVWVSNQRKRPELRRVPSLTPDQRPVLAYWWQEADHG